jgi:hypothetical protein
VTLGVSEPSPSPGCSSASQQDAAKDACSGVCCSKEVFVPAIDLDCAKKDCCAPSVPSLDGCCSKESCAAPQPDSCISVVNDDCCAVKACCASSSTTKDDGCSKKSCKSLPSSKVGGASTTAALEPVYR